MKGDIDDSDLKLDDTISFKPVQLFELTFNRLNVVATIEQDIEVSPGKIKKQEVQKTILSSCTGVFSPNTFTAIVGPSGCGKTTLLNLLSGRLLSTNLQLTGQILVNQQETNDINVFGDKIGYVMQEDLLMPTFTPRESFQFIANMRLVDSTQEERDAKVEEILVALGLSKCSDTWVGNHLIRGVSGGEKKRVSIGVELLVNPSILFLDEPTTGLDSTTALNVMRFLNRLAKSGRTIISTIHQPSSEIFAEFDRLFIMVQGNIVYQGVACDSMAYFSSIGYPVPSRSNPTDFYMKVMNKEGLAMEYIEKDQDFRDDQITKEFQERVQYFKAKYAEKPPKQALTVSKALERQDRTGYLPFCSQFKLVMVRSMVNQFRNPLDVRLRIIQMIVQALFCVVLFYQPGTGFFNKIQNTTGAIFFLVTVSIISGFASNLHSFSNDRPIFIRQRMSNCYSTSAYFWGRSAAIIPVELFLPILFLAICYFAINLDNSASAFFWTLLICELAYWMSASYALFISTFITDLTLAMSMLPIFIIPLMLVGGLFQDVNSIPKVFLPLEYLSMFKFSYQAATEVQFSSPIMGPNGTMINMLDTKFQFPDAFWLDLVLMGGIGLLFRILGYFSMEYISNPKRVSLSSNKNNKNKEGSGKVIPVESPSNPNSQAIVVVDLN